VQLDLANWNSILWQPFEAVRQGFVLCKTMFILWPCNATRDASKSGTTHNTQHTQHKTPKANGLVKMTAESSGARMLPTG